MCITEYDEEKNNELLKADSEAIGRAKERFILLTNLIKKGKLTENEAAEEANMSVDEFRKVASQFA